MAWHGGQQQWHGDYHGGGGYRPGPGSGRGSKHHGGGNRRSPPQGRQENLRVLEAGEAVHVFHRYCQDPNGYFMVDDAAAGLLHPSVGRTDGWTEAKVKSAWYADGYDVNNYNTWPEIMWTHKRWYNRRGIRLDITKPQMVTQRVPVEQIRRKSDGNSEASRPPRLTLLHVRWGGSKPVDPVTEGAGGWGQIGSNPSDNYINGWEDQLWRNLGPNYEIISAFIQGSDELGKINPSLVRQLARGHYLGALYFLWPIMFQDGHQYPAYVNRDDEYKLMVNMEAAGIATRFPHPAHLYKIFASKEWTTWMCLQPMFNVPLTVAVSRQACTVNPGKAAEKAVQALANLSRTRSAWNQELKAVEKSPAPITKGVAKLGYSWEAMDVQIWESAADLGRSLDSLTQQPGSLADLVLVQEWVDFDVEMRFFVIEPNLDDKNSLIPKKAVFTMMKSVEDNCFREFDRFERQTCLQRCFAGDEAAMQDAERQAQDLITKWLHWFHGTTSELPMSVRFDILAKRVGPGKAKCATGELTELGACFLGWPEGPEVMFGAMMRACMKDALPDH
eukprot:TRINITY_DN1128_c1_g1_i1.p1 TRINITY_DN1128_c1_g1~~TRINITY_DN1128_c1_g1_i1.p1  ORF type:complete len:559 (+),score=120.86 TRINITY_DN1128_c1_g1_i1:226-1902(+)